MVIHATLGVAGPRGHGKTALIRALCGAKGDRLPDEKRWGGTIDLNFAHLERDDVRLGVIDLPGDRRFLANALAGVMGLDAALLVFSAAQPVPWACDHLDMLRFLDIPGVVIALTHCDLVPAAEVGRIESEVRQLVGNTFAVAPVVRTSPTTGDGIEALHDALIEACRTAVPRLDPGWFRLPIDRAFALKDAGTVVTGTIASGVVRPGDELEVQPAGRRVRVGSVQNHGRSVTEASQGQRAALNLGEIEVGLLRRGQQIARPDYLTGGRVMAVRVTGLVERPHRLRHGMKVHVHVGTAEAVATVALFDRDSIGRGESTVAQLLFDSACVAVWGERFILRDLPTGDVIGGGRVLHPCVRRCRRRNVKAVDRLDALASSDEGSRATAAGWLAGLTGFTLPDLVRCAGVTARRARELIEHGLARGEFLPLGPEEAARFIHADVGHASQSLPVHDGIRSTRPRQHADLFQGERGEGAETDGP